MDIPVPDALARKADYAALPLWAQVLTASRHIRRAVLSLPVDVPDSQRAKLIAGCDAMDRCTVVAQRLREEQEAIRLARDLQPVGSAGAAACPEKSRAPAAHAAEASLDFSAAETACSCSVGKSLAESTRSLGMNHFQLVILISGDVDLLRFFCEEHSIGRYDGLTRAVVDALPPVHPSDDRSSLGTSPRSPSAAPPDVR